MMMNSGLERKWQWPNLRDYDGIIGGTEENREILCVFYAFLGQDWESGALSVQVRHYSTLATLLGDIEYMCMV
jgi:hypothetical protein